MNENIYNNEMNLELQQGYNQEAQKNQEAYIQWLYNYAADLMLNQGFDNQETINALVEKGVNNVEAAAMVDELNEAINKEEKDGASTDILLGLLFAIGGVLLSYNTNYIFIGAVIYGVVKFFQGIGKLF